MSWNPLGFFANRKSKDNYVPELGAKLNVSFQRAKQMAESLKSIEANLLTKTQETADFAAKVQAFLDSAKAVSAQGRICLEVSKLVVIDAEDVAKILQDASIWSRKYGSRYGMMSASLKNQAVDEYNQMRIDFNAHVERSKTQRAKVTKITGVKGKLPVSGTSQTLNEVLMEERDLAGDLNILARQVELLAGKADQMSNASKQMQSRSNELNSIAKSTQATISAITNTTTALIQSASNFGALQNQLNEIANTAHMNGADKTHDHNDEGLLLAKSQVVEPLYPRK